MKVTLKGNTLHVELECLEKPCESTSGKTMVVATSKGNVTTEVIVNGKNLVVGVNAYIPKG